MRGRLVAALGLFALVSIAAVLLSEASSSRRAVAQVSLTRVIGVGDPSPLGGSPFDDLNFLQLGDDGSVAFSGCVDACDRAGIFVKQPNEPVPQELVTTGDLASSAGATLVGFECNRYFPFTRNDAGQIAFGALLDSCNSGREGAFTRTNAGVSSLVLSGDIVAGKTVTHVSTPELSDNGSTAFAACFDSCTSSSVVVGNELTLARGAILWNEAKLDGTPSLIGMNNSGNILHISPVEELGETANCMIITTPSLALNTRVACVGDVLFGLPLDDQIRVVDFNNGGHLVFGSSDQAIYYWSGSSIKVAQAGENAPGGGKYRQFIGHPHLNDLDQLTYTAQVEFDDGRLAYTVFFHANGASTPLYMAGTDADAVSGRCIFDVDLNDAGQVLVGVNDCGGATSYFIGAVPAVDPTPTPTPTVTPSPPRKVVIFVQGYASCLTAGREYGSSCGTDSVEDEVFRALKEELRAVGFEEADFLEFSYSGGHVDEPSGRWIPDDYACTEPSSRTYEAPAFELRSMVMAYRARHPNVEIALVGHSFGGLVALEATRYVLAGVDTSGITTVVTVDSPLNGVPANWFSNARDNVLAFLDTWLNRFPCQRPFLDSPATDSVKALYGATALRLNRELKREAIDAGIAIWNAGNTSDCIWVPSSCNPYENLEREVARWRGDYSGTQFIGGARNIRVRIVPACRPAGRRCTFGDAAASHSALLTSSRSVAPTVRRQIAACIIGPQVGDPNVC